ncbi:MULTISPECIES: DUF6086 family protein [Streptacidiphilus]|uniref:DUF6086 family protein n=1 Tax=Streptacidiphilus cavernicola TaxID=3342716 RepID=A0ABV6V1D2_9ACTN|nr:DUF6086 family protein [Streptacidiphilus jeojiense]
MSQYFDLGERTLWNPSNGATGLFLRQVSVFEAELGLPSGIGPMSEDECQIDPATLKLFVEALLERHRRTGHAVVIALSEGFLATVIVLAERADIKLTWPADDQATYDTSRDLQVPGEASNSISACVRLEQLRDASRELSRFMAR